MNLLKTRAGNAPLQNTKILLCINVKGFIVDGLRLLVGILVVVEDMVEIVVVLVLIQEVKLIVDGGIHCDWSKTNSPPIRSHHQSRHASHSHSHSSSSTTMPADIEQKLKALKVADLKAVLAKADVDVPARATKADLVARIVASEPAQDAYKAIYEPCVTSIDRCSTIQY